MPTQHSISKPYPEFPLSPHKSGKWIKSIKGKSYYFGSVDDWRAALDEYLEKEPYIRAGKPLPGEDDGCNVEELCEQYLEAKKELLDNGELSERHYADCKATCQRIDKFFGRYTPLEKIGKDQLREFRRALANGLRGKKLGLKSLHNLINRSRGVFKYAYDVGLIDSPIRFRGVFEFPSAKSLRKEANAKKREHGIKMFTSEQLHTLVAAANPAFRAMILLAINAGLGNEDIGQIELGHINAEGKTPILDFPRPKTEVERRCPLWPETIAAIKEYADKHRPKPSDRKHRNRIFITKRGNSYAKGSTDNPITKEFRKLLDKTEIYRPGLSFYAIRHTMETVGGDLGDQVAVNYIMGHVDSSMAGNYRQSVFEDRLKKVTNHVHAWLFDSSD